MGKRKDKPRIPPYLRGDEYSGNFAMIPPDLFEMEGFKNLTYAARAFYLMIAAHVTSMQQRECLYNALQEYNQILSLGLTEEDIKESAWGNKRAHTFSRLFVIPESHLKNYGYSAAYANKLKKELIEKGFIKIKYGGKGKYTAWSKNVTVYEFVSEWKKFST